MSNVIKKIELNNTTYDIVDAGARELIQKLEGAVIFKGTVGEGGTIPMLPMAKESNKGFMYKAISDSPDGSATIYKNGDTLISNGSEWVVIPSGDEPSGTVTNVATGNGLKGGPITTTGTISVDTDVVALKEDLDNYVSKDDYASFEEKEIIVSQDILNKSSQFLFEIPNSSTGSIGVISASDLFISENFIEFPNNTGYGWADIRISDMEKMSGNPYFDPNKIYIIAAKWEASETCQLNEGDSYIVCNDPNGTTFFEDNGKLLIYIGKILSSGSGPNIIACRLNPLNGYIGSPTILIEELSTEYVDGIITGEDKEKYDEYEDTKLSNSGDTMYGDLDMNENYIKKVGGLAVGSGNEEIYDEDLTILGRYSSYSSELINNLKKKKNKIERNKIKASEDDPDYIPFLAIGCGENDENRFDCLEIGNSKLEYEGEYWYQPCMFTDIANIYIDEINANRLTGYSGVTILGGAYSEETDSNKSDLMYVGSYAGGSENSNILHIFNHDNKDTNAIQIDNSGSRYSRQGEIPPAGIGIENQNSDSIPLIIINSPSYDRNNIEKHIDLKKNSIDNINDAAIFVYGETKDSADIILGYYDYEKEEFKSYSILDFIENSSSSNNSPFMTDKDSDDNDIYLSAILGNENLITYETLSQYVDNNQLEDLGISSNYAGKNTADVASLALGIGTTVDGLSSISGGILTETGYEEDTPNNKKENDTRNYFTVGSIAMGVPYVEEELPPSENKDSSNNIINPTKVKGNGSSAFGIGAIANGNGSHAEGINVKTENSNGSHIEGIGKNAEIELPSERQSYLWKSEISFGIANHVEGISNYTQDISATHVEGLGNRALPLIEDRNDDKLKYQSNYSISDIINDCKTGYFSVTDGKISSSHIEGKNNYSYSDTEHIEGYENFSCNNVLNHIEGANNYLNRNIYLNHIEGVNNSSDGGVADHIEGTHNIIQMGESTNENKIKYITKEERINNKNNNEDYVETTNHIEGSYNNIQLGSSGVHAEGYGNGTGRCFNCHIEGIENYIQSNIEGAHVSGLGNEAGYDYETVIGTFNQPDYDNATLFIVGNGYLDEESEEPETVRQNAFVVYRDGHAEIQQTDMNYNKSVVNLECLSTILYDNVMPKPIEEPTEPSLLVSNDDGYPEWTSSIIFDCGTSTDNI